ncbi:MAG: phosphatidate cytidylyltransferase [Chloroflexota bacterium]|nr:phosphatidate cytidylyltransferase [Chloroflexota bacterium]
MDSANAVSEPSRKPLDRNLIERILSAVVLLPIVTLIVWWGEPLVTVTVMLLAVLALHELFSLFRGGGYTPRRSAGFLSVLLFVIAARVRVSVEPLDWTGFALVTSIIASLSVELPRHNRDRSLLHWSLTLSGAAYIGWTLAHFVLLRDIRHPLLPGSPLRLLRLDSGAAWIVFVLAVTFLSDTGAYFTGRAFGRHRMAPYISPKKSWEGAAGGVVLATLAGVGFTPLLGLPIDPWVGGLLGAIGSVAGQAGDLAESLIKRQVDIKDSGKIIPGHGGLLDRVDSLLFTAPVLYYMITIALLTR